MTQFIIGTVIGAFIGSAVTIIMLALFGGNKGKDERV